MNKFRLLALAAALTFVLGAASAAAGGQTQKVKTTVKARFKPRSSDQYGESGTGSFRGGVASRSAECVGGRKVLVSRRSKKVGSTRTNDRGRFRIKVAGLRSGSYTVTVKPRTAKKGAGKLRCGAASTIARVRAGQK
jgi:hypothetical protein